MAPRQVVLTFHFSVPGLADFAPQWTLPLPEVPVLSPDHPIFRRLVFSLGLVELVSYWKIACPPVVRIRCGQLDDWQKQWWKQQYLSGLGEFFYKNGITTVGTRQLPAVASSPYYQLFLCERQRLPIVDYGYLRHRQLKKGFLLSTSFLYEEQPFYDLMPLASLLCMEGAAGAQEILAAMTLRPAKALKLSGKRGIRKGADADMIVFQARDLEELFCSFGRQRLHRIIHQGVHIYPHVII